ncbi:ABC transporter substrate-binding protein [Streptomyces ovatisporus]|uniref:ABC transporter substrate-binding protein n=1 Tax=Streptomyces ovatisporus TaxID=1128682 RepID=A0ABV8ZZE1_9ACTN
MPGADADNRRRYETTPHVTGMLDSLFREFRRRRSMAVPLFVVHPDSEDAAADDHVLGVVEELGEELAERGIRCASVKQSSQDGEDGELHPRVRALHLVQELCGKKPVEGREPCVEPDPWRGGRGQYVPYVFPRSDLLSTIEDAVAQEGRRGSTDGLLKYLNSKGWRPGGTHWATRLRGEVTNASKTLPALLIAVIAVVVAGKPWFVTLGFVAAVFAVVIALSVLPGRAPLLLGLRREIRWFLGTTYLNQGPRAERGERGTWRFLRLWPPGSVRQRVDAVARDLRDSRLLADGGPDEASVDAQRRHLQLRVHALREDLRDAHAAWSLDLRGRKRPTPPVLVLAPADKAGGSIELIKAISDIRSVRSELDPLLVIAAVRQQDVEELQSSFEAPLPAHPMTGPVSDIPEYADWNRSRRVNQSPSTRGSTLPWVLRVPLTDDWLSQARTGRRRISPVVRPRWTWLWSSPALVLLLCAAAVGLWIYDSELGERYCAGGLSGVNRDSERVRIAGDEEAECVGVATGTVSFPVAPKVQKLIRTANAEIGRNEDHVTIVYAGPLSGSSAEQLTKGLEELRGVHLAQRSINQESSVKLRVLVANGGQDMYAQKTMARHITDLARRDESIVGVVGMGRDMTDSDDVQEMLREADLPVVSSTNSGTHMTRYPNFFGLAATDEWQNDQLRLVADQLTSAPGKERAVVLARDHGRNSHDQYTKEQKKYGEAMLEDAGYRVERLHDYGIRNGRPVLDTQIEAICGEEDVPLAVYFAGRSEDVTPLMRGIASNDRCNKEKIAVLAGDDLSKARFGYGTTVAKNVTIYHLTLTALEQSLPGSLFLGRLDRLAEDGGTELGLTIDEALREDRVSPKLDNGQTALSHDATEVLHQAAESDGEARSRAETWAALRQTDFTSLATGRINFTEGADQGGDRFAISVVKVTNRDGRGNDREILCSRQAGPGEALTKKECSIG